MSYKFHIQKYDQIFKKYQNMVHQSEQAAKSKEKPGNIPSSQPDKPPPAISTVDVQTSNESHSHAEIPVKERYIGPVSQKYRSMYFKQCKRAVIRHSPPNF